MITVHFYNKNTADAFVQNGLNFQAKMFLLNGWFGYIVGGMFWSFKHYQKQL